MNIVVAIDSFKGCLSSLEAGEAARNGLLARDPSAQVRVFPLADGGEGTVEALTAGLGGSIEHVTVTGPLGEPIESRYGYLPKTQTAVIEMADAAGLPMIPTEKRNPLHTTTYGVGELIRAAAHRGCQRFIIGIGGSATNDCGLGMLSALGVRFQKTDGSPAGITGGDLGDVAVIDLAALDGAVREAAFSIACDVTNPLCGKNGCSAVYGPQKGATPEIVTRMDADIRHFAEIAGRATGVAAMDRAGAGAAGGLGFAFSAFLGGSLVPGGALILSAIPAIREALARADLLVTGEGCMDEQSAMGKAPVAVAALAKKCRPACRTVALCGGAKRGAEAVNAAGIDAFFPILSMPMALDKAMHPATARENLARTARQVLGLLAPCR